MFDRFVDFFYQHVVGGSAPAVPALTPGTQLLLGALLLFLGLTAGRFRHEPKFL